MLRSQSRRIGDEHLGIEHVEQQLCCLGRAGIKVASGKAYDNRFVSIATIEDRKIVHWRDYMDSLAAFTA